MIKVGVLICLITLTSQLVHCKVITVNITSGNSSHECCTEEGCMCASLSIALQYIDSNTTINITSSSVILEESVKLGSGNLTNITITGRNVTIMCNNSGSVYCESCDDVTIEGITWDRCGNPNGTNIAGVTFNGTNNISLVNCTFQLSQIPAVTFLDVSGNVNISESSFLLNKRINLWLPCNCGGLHIHYSSSDLVHLVISDSYFYSNGFCYGYESYDGDLGLVLDVLDTKNLTMWDITITKTIFFSNMGPVIFDISGSSSIQLTEVTFDSNTALSVLLSNVLLDPIQLANLGIMLYGDSCSVSVLSSLFKDNIGDPFLWDVAASNDVKILIMDSIFTNNQQGSIRFISSTSLVLITLVDVEICRNLINNSTSLLDKGGILSIKFHNDVSAKYYNGMVNFTRVSLISNKYLRKIGGAIYIHYDIAYSSNVIVFEECKFFNNTSSRGAAFYSDNGDNNIVTIFYIINSKIYSNVADDSVIYLNYMNVNVKSSTFTDNAGSSMYLLVSNLQCDDAIFANNTSDNGAALFLDQGSFIDVGDNISIQFTNNSVVEHGGAIYINLVYDCPSPPFHESKVLENSVMSFVNNTAGVSGNSLYFYVSKHCEVESNISNQNSIIYACTMSIHLFTTSQQQNDEHPMLH